MEDKGLVNILLTCALNETATDETLIFKKDDVMIVLPQQPFSLAGNARLTFTTFQSIHSKIRFPNNTDERGDTHEVSQEEIYTPKPPRSGNKIHKANFRIMKYLDQGGHRP